MLHLGFWRRMTFHSVSLHLLFIYLFVLHGVIQAAQSEWQTLAASACPHDRVWLREKLLQVHLRTLHQYVKDAGVPLGKNPNKEWCVAALLDKEFPVAPRFCRTLSLWVDSFFPWNIIGHISLCRWIMTVYVDICEKKIYIYIYTVAARKRCANVQGSLGTPSHQGRGKASGSRKKCECCWKILLRMCWLLCFHGRSKEAIQRSLDSDGTDYATYERTVDVHTLESFPVKFTPIGYMTLMVSSMDFFVWEIGATVMCLKCFFFSLPLATTWFALFSVCLKLRFVSP